MSIIYDALKKVENKEKAPLPPKKNPVFIFLLCAACAGIALFFIVLKLPHKKQVPPVLAKKTPGGKMKAPPAAAQAGVQDKSSQESAIPVTYVLEGIVYDQEAPLAVINGKILKKDDKIGNATVVKINRDSVELLNLETKTAFALKL